MTLTNHNPDLNPNTTNITVSFVKQNPKNAISQKRLKIQVFVLHKKKKAQLVLRVFTQTEMDRTSVCACVCAPIPGVHPGDRLGKRPLGLPEV